MFRVSMCIGVVPFFQVKFGSPAWVLLFLRRSLPRLVRLFRGFPVEALPRIVLRSFLAHRGLCLLYPVDALRITLFRQSTKPPRLRICGGRGVVAGGPGKETPDRIRIMRR